MDQTLWSVCGVPYSESDGGGAVANGERVMPDPLNKADRYRKEAVKCYELAKSASPAVLSGFYRRIAAHYLFMAEAELKLVEKEGSLISKQTQF